MGNFRIYQEDASDFTVVNNLFIDNYMADANDAQLKIYLYLLRMLNAALPTGVSDIADRFNYTEKDVNRALDYWDNKGVIRLERAPSGELAGVRIISLRDTARSSADIDDVSVTTPDAASLSGQSYQDPSVSVRESNVPAGNGSTPIISIRDYSKPQYTSDDLNRFRAKAAESDIFYLAEIYLKRELTQDDIVTLMYISEQLGFSDELIDYLLEMCADKGKTSIRYVEKVALDWAQNGITTPKQASEHLGKYDSAYKIMRALGKNSDPSTVELEYINKWRNSYGFDNAVILEACARTVMSTDRSRFRYADSILADWKQKGVHTVADISKLDPQKKPQTPADKQPTGGKNKFNQFTQNKYDFDELERKLISN
ncbi:MAG: DnaD domain protein [Lachnospiraceae bacterium]|nr:DnaD domain protein [Lachnospiraceae bacterium]